MSLPHNLPETILDCLPGMVAYFDRDLTYRYNNRLYEIRTKRSKAELVGVPLRDILGPDGFAQLLPHVQRALAGETVRLRRQARHPDGSGGEVVVHYIPDRAADGTVRGVVVFVMDVDGKPQQI
jgi:PAS domain S-box-containing protein